MNSKISLASLNILDFLIKPMWYFSDEKAIIDSFNLYSTKLIIWFFFKIILLLDFQSVRFHWSLFVVFALESSLRFRVWGIQKMWWTEKLPVKIKNRRSDKRCDFTIIPTRLVWWLFKGYLMHPYGFNFICHDTKS